MRKRIITARIDAQIEFKIEFLKCHLGEKSTTTILTEAVHNLFNVVKEREKKQTPFEILEELNLIGCFEGEESLSQIYKDEISKSLNKKYKSKKTKCQIKN